MTNKSKYFGEYGECAGPITALINEKIMENDPNICVLDIISGKHNDCISSDCECCIKKWLEMEA